VIKKYNNSAIAEQPLPPLGDTLHFMRLIWTVDHALQSRSKLMDRAIGVTGPQRLVIRIVGRFPGISAGRLAEILQIDPSTLTGILRRLEKKKLIGRRTDDRDGRRSLVGLTDKGIKLNVDMAETIESAVRKTLAATANKKLKAAEEVLVNLARALQAPDADLE
jgi:MarR family transcriptional regulator, organic hydroperoxide resistance regulator